MKVKDNDGALCSKQAVSLCKLFFFAACVGVNSSSQPFTHKHTPVDKEE